MKQNLIDFVKGYFLGLINIIPGFSTSTMAIILGLYEKCINSFSRLFKHPKAVIKETWPIVIGIVLGIASSVYIIATLLETFPIIITLFFVGLIVGSIPKQFVKLRGKKIRPRYIIVYIISFAILIILPMINAEQISFDNFHFTFWFAIQLFLVGITGAFALIMGASGTIVVMGLGFYEITVVLAKSSMEFLFAGNFLESLYHFLYLLPFMAGTIVGLSLCSTLVKKLFEHQHMTLNYIIFGLITAAPVIVMYKLFDGNANLTDSEQLINWLIGIVTFLVGVAISYVFIIIDKRRKQPLALDSVVTLDQDVALDESLQEDEEVQGE